MKNVLKFSVIALLLAACSVDDANEVLKTREELLNQKEELLNAKDQLMKEKAALENKAVDEVQNAVSKKIQPRFTDMRGNPCEIGETYFAVIRDKDGYTNVRTAPNAKSAIVTQINEGEEFEVVITENDWLKVTTASGKTGYIFWDRVEVSYIAM